MSETMPDLTFLDSQKKLWEKDILQKIEQCIYVFKENGGDEATEDCFNEFCLNFDSAKYNFINKIRDIRLIMKCRTKADDDSKFGGQQCAEFMHDIQNACNKYLNATIYYESNYETSPVNVIRKMRNMAEASERKAWEFEDRARQTYASSGKDITLDIINETIYTEINTNRKNKSSGLM